MVHLSLRYQLGLALIVVNLLLTAGVALVTYRAAHDALVDQALAAVGLVAESRQRELQELLGHRQERLAGFLASLRSLCGERAPSGRFGFEDECVGTAVGGFHRSERARSTLVTYRTRTLAAVGTRPTVPPPDAAALARIVAGPSGAYAMRADADELVVRVEFSLDDINAIFDDRAGLESNGEAFLATADGRRVTSPPPTRTRPASEAAAVPVSACVQGSGQALQANAVGAVPLIVGLRPAPLVGNGCIVVHVSYADATAPTERLGRLLLYASGLMALVGGVVSIVIASVATGPLKRLARSTRALGTGDFDTPVPVEGPSEVRQLGRTLRAMAASIGDLVGREQRARREAEEANRTKDHFLATLSHELRTPLNAILGWASILARSDYDKARVSQAVHVIERNARIQAQMVEELLDVSRISAGTIALQVTDVSVAHVVDGALEAIRPAAEAQGVTVTPHVEPPTLVVAADGRRLQQIVWNLLSNAVRFTPAGGRVEVRAREDRGELDLQVVDTGCGISAEFLPHVFERFRQADAGGTRAQGLGLGLAIVHDLVRLHGGHVSAHSAGEGQGATFSVRLPGARVSATPPAAASVSRGARLFGARVLVVDDDRDAREVLKTLLEDAGAQVAAAASAGEARALFARDRPDLLIADIGMPGEDGYAFVRSIRSLENASVRVPAIALTARTRPEDVQCAQDAGFQLHLAKPVDLARLVDSIVTLVGSRA